MAEPKPKTGTIVHIEVHTKDVAKAKKFYGDVFGWTFEDVPRMNYTLFKAPDKPHGGIQEPMEGRSPTAMSYIYANDIKKVAQKVERAGGKILMPVTEISGIGWFSVFEGPGGEVLAIYEDMPKR